MNWMYCEDKTTGIEWKWSAKDSHVWLLDSKTGVVINQKGVSLVEIIRYYQQALAKSSKSIKSKPQLKPKSDNRKHTTSTRGMGFGQ